MTRFLEEVLSEVARAPGGRSATITRRQAFGHRSDKAAAAAGRNGAGYLQPFTAPAVRPSTRKRRTSIENTSTGSITSEPPAAMRPQSQPS